MYQFQKTELTKDRSSKYRLYRRDERLCFSDFLQLLQEQEGFRSSFIEVLAGLPFAAYHWETPSVTLDTIGQPFEFVVSNSPGIDLPPDPGPFLAYFDEDAVAVFDNLGGDAKLIAPKPHPNKLNYSHIGAFSSNAPMHQQHALWKMTGKVMEAQISGRPLWLNTAGGGVPWLHIRLDSRPKYYRHQAYRDTAIT